MIAMALTCDPKLIFADEPTTALDVTVQAQILKLFGSLQEKFSTAIVLISHDLGVIANNCDSVMVMYAGQVMEKGSPEEIFENPSHPYTRALKESIPDLYPKEGQEETLKAIEGLPPNLMKLKKTCPFVDRCEFSSSKCSEGVPPLKKITNSHFTRCIK